MVPGLSGSAGHILCAGKKMVGEADIRLYLDRFDKKYWATYKVRAPAALSDALQACTYPMLAQVPVGVACIAA